MKKDFIKTAKIIILGLVLSLGVSFISASWSSPVQSPTGSNTNPPIDEGAVSQVKNGGLGLDNLLVGPDNIGIYGDLIAGSSNLTSTLTVDSVNERVGIGVASPTTALDVYGSIKSSALSSPSQVFVKGGGGPPPPALVQICADLSGKIQRCP